MYHDHHAAIIVEYDNQISSQQAQQILQSAHPDLDSTYIEDMRTILNYTSTSTHYTPRLSNATYLSPSQSRETSSIHINASTKQNMYTYRLINVPFTINHRDISYNLSYYGQIEQLQEIDDLPPTKRELLITFDKHAHISLLDNIWTVNV